MSASVSLRAFRPDDLGTDATLARQIAAQFAGITIESDGVIVAVGGLAKVGPHWWTFLDIRDGRARRPMLIYRLLKSGLVMSGLPRVLAYCDHEIAGAHPTLTRLGFRLLPDDEKDDAIMVTERWLAHRRGQATETWVWRSGDGT